MNLPEKSITILLTTLILFGANAISIRGQTPIKINGSVTSDLSNPIQEARLSLYSLDRVLQTRSDAWGHFQFDNVPPGIYQLEVTANGYKTFTRSDLNVADLERSASGNKSSGLNVMMRIAPTDIDCGLFDTVVYDGGRGNQSAALNGVVVPYDPGSKQPFANVDVFLLRMDLVMGEQRTNDRGEFHFHSIVPGRYTIVIRHPGYWELRTKTFWVARENATHITLRLLPLNQMVACP